MEVLYILVSSNLLQPAPDDNAAILKTGKAISIWQTKLEISEKGLKRNRFITKPEGVKSRNCGNHAED